MGYLTGGGGFGSYTITPPKPKVRPASTGGYSNWGGGVGAGGSYSNPSYHYMNSDPYGYGNYMQAVGAANSIYGYDQALADRDVLYAGLNGQILGNEGAQRNASLGQDNAYAGQQIGWANQGAALARQLLGLDRVDLGLDREGLGLDRVELGLRREDTTRQNEMDRWNLGNTLTGRGAMVTAGSRTQHADLAAQLRNAMSMYDNEGNRIDLQGRRIDNEGNRIDVREDQVDLNLAEQVGGYRNRQAQNRIQQRYGNVGDYLQGLGYEKDVADAIAKKMQVDSEYAAYLEWVLANSE